MLKEDVERYIALRRSTGFKLKESAKLLANYAEFAEGKGERYIRTQTAIAWASQASTPDMCYRRITDVIRLGRHLRAEDARHEIPPEGVFTSHRTKFVPYIFTADEIARFIKAAYDVQKNESLPVRREIYAVLFGLVSVTGLRISEALELRLTDIQQDGILHIRKAKFGKSRLVPLHPSTSAVLDQYLTLRRDIISEDDYLFLSEGKRKICYSVAHSAFHKILDRAGIAPGRERRPRIHDLRHSFATRVLEQCGAGEDAIARHAVALMTYMGHSNLRYTYRYLHRTPELLAEMAQAAEALVAEGRR
ncbi:MAG: tyrosine-type recombinase/integrase [Rhodospirillaceae bacterium]|nr:tyrosine-type recombinase/integrase [Rhodospirillaceae bacterium]MYB11978.1 tyrosine-type recombinase/integrase [Rhodospirillaceae bacterium]MYI48980.1 tyrosine-type recombinase/integrase [Rhodospirillaceae bacterium]